MLRPLLTIELSCDRFDAETPVELLLSVVVVAAGAWAVGATVVVAVVVGAALGACGN